MGSRAVLCFDKYGKKAIAIYLHWNGNLNQVEAFLKDTRELMDDRLGDACYARARH